METIAKTLLDVEASLSRINDVFNMIESTIALSSPAFCVRDIAETEIRAQRDARGTRIFLWVACDVEVCTIRGEISTLERAENILSREADFES